MAPTVADSVTMHSPTRDQLTASGGPLPMRGLFSDRDGHRLAGAARDQCIVFVVATGAYIAIALFWLARSMNPITGDEPHYLVAAQALAYNHSLDLRPIYRQLAWSWLAPGELHVVESGTALRSGHGLATAVLVALPYRWFGLRGAKVALCVWAGVLVSLVYRVLLCVTAERGWSLAVALVLALSLPNTMGAGQIYPDLTAGLLRLYLVYQLARGFAVDDRRWLRLLGYALATGVLPWLQHRHFPVAAVFTAAFLVRFLHDPPAEPGDPRPRQARDALRSISLLLPLGLMVGLQVLWMAYSLSVYGTLVYPGPARFLGWYSIMIALGLHLDQFHGLFFQNPLLFAALAGLPLFIRRTPRLFAVWAVVYVLSVAPIGTQTFGYGAWAFAGRYQWDLAPLWIFPLGHLIAWLLKRRGGAPALAATLAVALAMQVWFARCWIPNDAFLIQPLTSSVWTLDSFYGDLRWVLPVFSDPHRLLAHVPNWVWIGFAVLVACFTRIVRTRRSSLAGLCAATALVALLLAAPRVVTPLEIPGAALFRAAGRNDGSARVASADRDAPGFVSFGPYIALGAGCYETALFYEADAPSVGSPAVWENADAGRVLTRGELPAAASGAVLRSVVRVAPGEQIAKFEVRVWFTGGGRIRIEKLVIAPTTACAGSATAT